MIIGIIYTTNNESTRKSCKILEGKLNAETQLIPIEMAKKDCLLKYNFIILAASAIGGKVQGSFKLYVSSNLKTLKGRPLGLIVNCEEDRDRFSKAFTEELLDSSYIHSNFGYELNPDYGNYIERKKTNKLISKYKKNNENLPTLNIDEIDRFADDINKMIEKRVD